MFGYWFVVHNFQSKEFDYFPLSLPRWFASQGHDPINRSIFQHCPNPVLWIFISSLEDLQDLWQDDQLFWPWLGQGCPKYKSCSKNCWLQDITVGHSEPPSCYHVIRLRESCPCRVRLQPKTVACRRGQWPGPSTGKHREACFDWRHKLEAILVKWCHCMNYKL